MKFFRGDKYLSLERTIDKYLGAPLTVLFSLFLRHKTDSEVIPPEKINRILLVKLHGIGNIVMLLPAIRSLERHFPDAEIDFLTFDTNEGILEGIEEISRRHFIQRKNIRSLLLSTLLNIRLLKRRSYELVIDFEQFAYYSAIVSSLTGATYRIGFKNPTHWRHILFTRTVNYVETYHMTHLFMRLTRAAGAPGSPGTSREISINDEEMGQARGFLEQSGVMKDDVMVILHPGSSPNLTLRRWPAESFAALADDLVQHLGVRVLFSGSEAEVPLIERIAGMMKSPSVSAAGRLSVKAFSALVGMVEMAVSNDTATVQIASAMGTPVVGLYGPNTPFLYGPYGGLHDTVFYRELPCSPCLKNTERKISSCRQARCMELITPEDVYDGIRGKYFDKDGTLYPRFRKVRRPKRRDNYADRQTGT